MASAPSGSSAVASANMSQLIQTLNQASGAIQASGAAAAATGATPALNAALLQSTGAILPILNQLVSGPSMATSGPEMLAPLVSGPSTEKVAENLSQLNASSQELDKVLLQLKTITSENDVNTILNIALETARNKLKNQELLLERLRELNM